MDSYLDAIVLIQCRTRILQEIFESDSWKQFPLASLWLDSVSRYDLSLEDYNALAEQLRQECIRLYRLRRRDG